MRTLQHCILFPLPLSPMTVGFPLRLRRGYVSFTLFLSESTHLPRPNAQLPFQITFHVPLVELLFSFYSSILPCLIIRLRSGSVFVYLIWAAIFSPLSPQGTYLFLLPLTSGYSRALSHGCGFRSYAYSPSFPFNPCRRSTCLYPLPPLARFLLLQNSGASSLSL